MPAMDAPIMNPSNVATFEGDSTADENGISAWTDYLQESI
jgi:hypothetical protein